MTPPAADLALPRARLPERTPPTRPSAALFEAKVWAFRLAHVATDSRPAKLSKGDPAGFPVIVAQSQTALWSDPRPGEQAAQQGKVQNLRRAAREFDRLVLAPGAVFSFWRQLGRASRVRGFVSGRMLKEGCMVRAVGGGLCQLSNALYAAALDAGCEIVERHAHSRLVPGSAAANGRDATIAWNYVDLRFRAAAPLMLRVRLTRDMLEVQLTAPAGEQFAPQDVEHEASSANTCGTCQQTDCFRHEKLHATGRAAFLADENWPEFRSFIAARRKDSDVLAVPLNMRRVPRYDWGAQGAITAPLATLRRMLALRFAKTAPERRAAELKSAERIARSLAHELTPDVTDIIVAQSLLPTLWRDGHLGGRKFSVLMTRMPMAQIEARLNEAARAHPGRKSLSDFRADPDLLAAETEALAAADTIVTPHTEIARLYGGRAVLLDWHKPPPLQRSGEIVPRRIAFPGPAIARKGAYELRETAKTLDLEVVLVGSDLESAGFWNGVRTIRSEHWLDGVACVVQPALLEDAPRRLLQALASGVPVIATAACGLPQQKGLMLIEDVRELVSTLTPLVIPGRA